MILWEMNIRTTENRVKFASVFTQLLLFEHPIIPLKKKKNPRKEIGNESVVLTSYWELIRAEINNAK